jgi:putative endonuclease
VSRRGEEAEALAAEFLARRGLVVIARNYHCRLGEIDLIARDGRTTVFVEVRARSTCGFGGAAGSITAAKRARLTRAARHYLAHLDHEPPCRFDVLLIEGTPPRIEWLRDAFGQ